MRGNEDLAGLDEDKHRDDDQPTAEGRTSQTTTPGRTPDAEWHGAQRLGGDVPRSFVRRGVGKHTREKGDLSGAHSGSQVTEIHGDIEWRKVRERPCHHEPE